MSQDIHFLNVGQGDCTVFDVNGRLTVVDINNSRALDATTESELEEEAKSTGRNLYYSAVLDGNVRGSLIEYENAVRDILMSKYRSLLTDPVEFLKSQFPGREIWRFILTHPDMDHMTGLYRLRQEGFTIQNFWDTRHAKTLKPSDFNANGSYDYRDWEEYQRILGDPTIRKLYLHRGDARQFYDDDGIWIAAPTTNLEEVAAETEHWNHLSYVLYLQCRSKWVVLGGDASVDVWKDIYAVNRQWFENQDIALLKASHHGRDSGYHQPSVEAMSPEHTIISVGKLPDTDASNKYRHYSNVYTTRTHGDIRARVWDHGDVWLYDQDGKRIEKPIEVSA